MTNSAVPHQHHSSNYDDPSESAHYGNHSGNNDMAPTFSQSSMAIQRSAYTERDHNLSGQNYRWKKTKQTKLTCHWSGIILLSKIGIEKLIVCIFVIDFCEGGTNFVDVFMLWRQYRRISNSIRLFCPFLKKNYSCWWTGDCDINCFLCSFPLSLLLCIDGAEVRYTGASVHTKCFLSQLIREISIFSFSREDLEVVLPK